MIWATWSGPYFVRHVADDLVPPTLVEVHVDVGHLDALGVQEPLEDEPVLERVQVGDPQRVRHDGARGGAATRSHADPVLAREPDQVPDDQEVPARTPSR